MNELQNRGEIVRRREKRPGLREVLDSSPPPLKLRWATFALVEREGWRRRESNPRPKVRPRRNLHAYPFLFSHGRREETAKNRRPPDPVLLTVGRRAAAQPPACLMASDPQPPGEVEADAHSLIKLRERTDYPQLRDIPPDLRVSGARHASRESLPPSKPNRPHQVERAQP